MKIESFSLSLNILDQLIKQGIRQNKFGFNGEFSFEELRAITTLVVKDCDDLTGISKLPNLKSLKIVSNNLDSFSSAFSVNNIHTFNEINSLTSLEELTIWHDNNITDLDISNLANLRKITLFCNPNLTEIKGLDKLTNLDVIYINGCPLKNIGDPKKYLENTKKASINIMDYRIYNNSFSKDPSYLASDQNITFCEHIYFDNEMYTLSLEEMTYLHQLGMKIVADLNLKDKDDFTKAFLIYKYIASNIEYDTEALKYRDENYESMVKTKESIHRMAYINSSMSALKDKKSVCEGYVNAMIFLLDLCSIKAEPVICCGEDNILHTAIKIFIGDEYFYADPERDSYSNEIRYYNLTKEEMAMYYKLAPKESFTKVENDFASNILIKAIDDGFLDKYLTPEDKEYLITKIKSIKTNELYESAFHGLYHSQKVLLFTYLLSKKCGLTKEELELVLDVAIYHDIGRENDNEDSFHGYISSQKIGSIIKYKSADLNSLAGLLCEVHSVDDTRFQSIYETYFEDDKYYETFLKFAKIIKDADALDRTRFKKTASYALKEKFLRYDYSKELVPFAYSLNEYYQNFISENYYDQNKDKKTAEVLCEHGIGFNFIALESILEHGILSSFAKRRLKLDQTRNFEGNNNDLWISVTVGEGEAKKMFVDSGISFEASCDHLINGTTNRSKALSEGLPIDSRRYSDERFAFYQIPLEKIKKLKVNPEYIDKDISELKYLTGSMNYDSVVASIDMYLNYIRVNFNFFSDISLIEKVKEEYRNIILEYESKNEEEQKKEMNLFFSKIEEKLGILNCELQKIFNEVFTKYLGKTKVTLRDIIEYILSKKGINKEYKNGEFDLNLGSKII